MKRRSLALGAAIALPAGLAAFCADASAPPGLSRQRRCRPDADKAIHEMYRAYFRGQEDLKKVEAEPAAPFGSAADERQEADLTTALHCCRNALQDVSALAPETVLGLQLKGAMLADALVVAAPGAFELGADSCEFRLAASLCADLARLIQGGQA